MVSSICITVLNEENSIFSLLDCLVKQTVKPDEIIIVDGGSSDKTIKIINHFQKKYNFIKLVKEKCSRSVGRNLAVEIAKNNVIVMTDAGCIPHRRWLENIVNPFQKAEVDVSAGFYKMTYKNKFQKAATIFLGILPNKFNFNFLPSARSIAFTKDIWEKAGGFPEDMNDEAEDTVFNYKLIVNNAKIARVKKAIVEWGMPENIKEYFYKIYRYAKSDARSKIWIFPGKGITSHNIKSLFVLLRYLIFMFLLILLFNKLVSPFLVIFLFISYIFYIFRKTYSAFGEIDVAFYGLILQFITDAAVISGFLKGIFSK